MWYYARGTRSAIVTSSSRGHTLLYGAIVANVGYRQHAWQPVEAFDSSISRYNTLTHVTS